MAGSRAGAFPVTAYSVGNALGAGTREVLRRLEKGESGLRRSSTDLADASPLGEFAGQLDAPPPSLNRFDSRLVRMSLTVLDEIAPAVSRAVARWGKDRVAVVVGTSTGGIRESEHSYALWVQDRVIPLPGFDLVNRHSFRGVLEATRQRLGLHGPAYVVSTACSSSAAAIAAARRLLRTGRADAVLCGGADVCCLTTLRGFRSLGAISPSGCRPFSANRDGLSLGEGAAFLLLEKDGDGPAWLLGAGESSDAHHMSHPHPEGLGARMAMHSALKQARLDAGAIDLVNAHGTGTVANDAVEASAILTALGSSVPVCSTKGYTGHLLGAAGATEAVFGIASIERGFIPASLGANPVDPAVKVNIVSEPVRRRVRSVLSNSFAFGGANVSLLLGSAP